MSQAGSLAAAMRTRVRDILCTSPSPLRTVLKLTVFSTGWCLLEGSDSDLFLIVFTVASDSQRSLWLEVWKGKGGPPPSLSSTSSGSGAYISHQHKGGDPCTLSP